MGVKSCQVGERKREGLKTLAKKIANLLNERHVPQKENFRGRINFEEVLTHFINAYDEAVFNLYKCKITLLDPPFIQAVNVYEDRVREHCTFSSDHSEHPFAIPELITAPFGLRPGGFNEAQLTETDAIAFLQNAYRYSIALYQNLPLVRNVQVYLPNFVIIDELFDVVPRSFLCSCNWYNASKPYPELPSRVVPQLNTIIDLTHFASRPGLEDPLTELLRLSKTNVYNWLPPHLGPNRVINYELAILNFTRNIVHNMNSRLRRVPHMSDPWIKGAIGLGIWSVLSLCIGSRTAPHSHEKNLWFLMPKVNIVDFLMGACDASQNLLPSSNYYILLILHFIPAFQEVYHLLPQDGQLVRALNNSIMYKGKNLIEYRLMKWNHDPLPPSFPNLDPNNLKTIKRLIMATFMYAVPVSSLLDFYTRNDVIKEAFDSYQDLMNSRKFMRMLFNIYKTIGINDRGGYGRPKFELRSVPDMTVPPYDAPPLEPDYNKYINILNSVARPTVPIPFPPDVPAEYQEVFPSMSVDSGRTSSLYGGEIEKTKREQFDFVWIPGISEHGRRASAVSENGLMNKIHRNNAFICS